MNMKNFKKRRIGIIIIFSFVFLVFIFVVTFLFVRASHPYVADTFTTESMIVSVDKLSISTSTGEVALKECYSPSPSWTLHATTTVRDIAGAYNSTVNKDIYCDDNNCILWTYNATPPTTVCIATDSDVYANILWAGDDSGTATWGPTTSAILGDDIGGTHPAGTRVGNGNTDVGNMNWLNRYYVSSNIYPAMNVCKAKGDGWRLPTILELDSIRNQAMGSPYSHLPGISASDFWSASQSAGSNAYYLHFSNGSVYSISKSNGSRVRCVRGQ